MVTKNVYRFQYFEWEKVTPIISNVFAWSSKRYSKSLTVNNDMQIKTSRTAVVPAPRKNGTGVWEVITIITQLAPALTRFNIIYHIVMTSSNINIFRVTGPLCGEISESPVIGEFPSQRPVTRSSRASYGVPIVSMCRKLRQPRMLCCHPLPSGSLHVLAVF